MPPILSCGKCEVPLPAEAVGGNFIHCPDCQTWIKVVAFPALLGEAKKGSFGERVLVEGESTCFYHSEKKAAVVCEGCGRFLCSLCDIDLNGEHLCSSCLEAGKGKGSLDVDSQRTLYEDIALGLALIGLFIGPFGVIPAVVALFMSIRYWRKPEKIGAWGKTKKVLAIVASLIVMGLWASLLMALSA